MTQGKRAPWSLQRRLIAGIVALLAVVSVIVGAVTVAAQRQDLLSRLDEQIEMIGGFGARDGDMLGPNDEALPEDDLPPSAGPRQRFGALLVEETTSGSLAGEYTADDGSVVALSQDQLDALLAADLSERPTTVDLGGDLGTFRVAQRNVPSGTVISGLSLAELDTTVRNTALIFGAVTLVALLITAFGGALVVRVALRPLERIVGTAREVAARPLGSGDVDIPERVPDRDSDPRTEVGQVGAALNHLLANVESALSDRKASEDRLRRFVADASHELRTPLASIRGYAELSRRDGTPMTHTQERAIERIGAESVRMSSLVEDLLLLARLDSGQPLRRERVDVPRLLADAVSDAWAADQDHQWELDVLEEDGGVEIEGDPHRLHQVVANLLANARIHTPTGTRVVVSLAVDGDFAVVTVADEGPGISSELLPKVFERFARGDGSRSRDTGSSGLGLSIVAAIVAAHHGTIEAASTPHGATFTVRLPMAV